jgi:nucleoside phosphorylase
MNHSPIDFAVVTALKHERDALLQRLEDVTPMTFGNDPYTYYRGALTLPDGHERYELVVIQLLGVGNNEATAGTVRLIERWSPTYVLFVGIAGGVQGKVALGDVIVADFVYYYELAKQTSTGPQIRGQQFPTNRVLYGRAQNYEATEWRSLIGVAAPNTDAVAMSIPAVHFGTIGSGEKIVADSKTLKKLLQACPQLRAVAMEGAGVALAALNSGDPPGLLEVRSICDFANEHKNDDWQYYAAHTAAAFTIGFLRSRPVPPAMTTARLTAKKPRIVLCAQSLRPIAPDEILPALGDSSDERPVERVSLDWTDLMAQGVLIDPEAAALRLTEPSGALYGALARRAEADLIFHGLAHIPLAMLAGYIVSDRQPVRLYDFHQRLNGGTWAWPEDLPEPPSLAVSGLPTKTLRRPGDAVIRISVSYRVTPDQTRLAVPNPAIEVDLGIPAPTWHIVRSEAQTHQYGQVFRQALDQLVQRCPSLHRIHLFYSGPMALAFHLGQRISSNIHPTLVAWNFRQRYEWGLNLAAALQGAPSIVRPA